MFHLQGCWSGARRRKEVRGIPVAVTAKGIGRAVVVVRAGLDADVHDGTRFPAVLRARIHFGLELVNGVDGQNGAGIACGHDRIHDALGHPGIVAVYAVDQKHVVVRAEAIRALRPAGVAGILDHSGPQIQQVFKIAAIQGQLVNGSVFQSSAEFCIGGFDERKFAGDGDFFSLFTGLQG